MPWSFVIFILGDRANHVGIDIPDAGLADLSFAGARIIPWDERAIPKGLQVFYEFKVPHAETAFEFLQQNGLLMQPIIDQERARKGWHLSDEAPNYVRKFRSLRSRDVADMNCVEWVVRAVELGGLVIPDHILTPADLWDFCRCNLTLNCQRSRPLRKLRTRAG